MIKYIVPILLIFNSIYGYVGPENSNYIGEGKLLETDYRLAIHIPQQANHGVVIAVSGSGIKEDHEAFNANNFVGRYDLVTNESSVSIANKHETMVAGTIIGNSIVHGLRGINPSAKILNLDVEIESGDYSHQAQADAIRYAADNISGNCIHNMSWQSVGDANSLIKNALEYAKSKGCMLLTSGGNEGRRTITVPTNYPDVGIVSVTGLNASGEERHELGSVSATLKYAAPFELFSASLTSYTNGSGTSYSCPIIAGLASLIWGNNPSLDADGVYAILDLYGEPILNDPISTTEFKKIDVRALVESYVDLHERVVEADIDGDDAIEQLFLEISTDKQTGEFLKGYITHILDDDGTKISIFQEIH